MPSGVPAKLRSLAALLRSLPSSLEQQTALIQQQNELLRIQQDILHGQSDQFRRMLWHLGQSREIQDSIRAGLAVPVLDEMQAFLKERQLGLLESLEIIREHRLNLARFGDGELRLMLRLEYNAKFQKNSPALMEALERVFKTAKEHPDKLLVGMPHTYRDHFWANVHNEMWRQVQPMLQPIEQVANSQVSRPLMFSVNGYAAVEAWRSIWDGLAVTVVTGKGSRFDMIPELFDNVKSSHFEYSLPTQAFSDVPRLIERLKSSSSELILLSLGPSSTIVASELTLHGKWALDIGHLSNSYEQEFKGGQTPEKIPLIKQAHTG